MSVVGNRNVDVEVHEETRTDEDAPVGNSLRRSSQKATRNATWSIKLEAKEGVRKKISQLDWAQKRPVVGSPQVVEPNTSDPLHVLVLDHASNETDDDAMCLDSREEGAPTT